MAAAAAMKPDGWDAFSRAIMTTDKAPKVATARVGGAIVHGCAKGAGMIAPNMATTPSRGRSRPRPSSRPNFAFSQMAPSDQMYVSPDGTVQRDLHGNAEDRPLELNLGVGSEDAELRVIYHRIQVQDQILYGAGTSVVPQGWPGETKNSILAVSAKGNFKLTDRLSVAPRAIWTATG